MSIAQAQQVSEDMKAAREIAGQCLHDSGHQEQPCTGGSNLCIACRLTLRIEAGIRTRRQEVESQVSEARVALRATRDALACVMGECDRGISKAVSIDRIKVIAREARDAISSCRILRRERSS